MEPTSNTAGPASLTFARLRRTIRPGQLALEWFIDPSGRLSSRWVAADGDTKNDQASSGWPIAS